MGTLPARDVVIIGYGSAAGPLSVELARAGLTVVALERGPYRDTAHDFARSHDSLRYRVRGEWTPTFDRVPTTFRETADRPAAPDAGKIPNLVGGSSIVWGGFAYRFYRDDFAVRSTIDERYGAGARLRHLDDDGAALIDWPLSYDDLEPYYDRVEHTMGIGGWPGNIGGRIRPVNPDQGNPFEAPRARDFPFRPLRDNATGLAFRHGALSLGLAPFQSSNAIVTEPFTSPYGIARSACTYCAFCSGHGCWNGAKTSTLVALLPAALATGNFELRPECRVVKINHSGGRVTSVEYLDAMGRRFTQPGTFFILAANTVQNIRLLLASGIASGGLVGRYFMNHRSPEIKALFADRHLNGYASPGVQAQCVEDFNGENAADEKVRLRDDEFFIRGASILTPCQKPPLEIYADIPPDVPRWGRRYKDHLRENFARYLRLYVMSEGLPYYDNVVDLDPTCADGDGVPAARIQHRIGENERRMARYFYRKSVEILRASGASTIWGSEEPALEGSTTHDAGGCRMGDDPSTSVTNRYGQMWDLPNVFVTGAALFPTMSGHGPQETGWALSYWTADAILTGRVNLSDSAKAG